MSNVVRWEGLSPDTFEDMCAVLVSRLFPEARRIDGTGGDGGRDVQISTAAGPVIYEMKSFTGRLSQGRRQQIKRSLQRASQHSPAAWRLVIPIDPTPSELAWFEDITKEYPFECEWYGRTWLDSEFARHSDILKYYLQGTNDEIVSILRELSRESGALEQGVPDAVDRVQALARRLNELDPHYGFGISTDISGNATVTLWPKYAGAEYDRPIKIETLFEFPDDEHGRAAGEVLHDSINFGRPGRVAGEYIKRLKVDLPGGMGGDLTGGYLTLGPATAAERISLSVLLRIVDQGGRARAQLPLSGPIKNQGARGGDFSLSDATGAVKALLHVDFETRSLKFDFKYEAPVGVLPSAMLPALAFMEHYRPGNLVAVLLNGEVAAPSIPIETSLGDDLSPVLLLVRALDEIQRKTGVYFPFPEDLNSDAVGEIFVARRLLNGEEVKGKWSSLRMNSTVGALEGLRASLKRGPQQLMSEVELTLEVSGYDIPLGFTRRLMPTAVVAEWPQIDEGVPPDTPVQILFKPGDDDTIITTLIGSDQRMAAP